MKRKTETCRRLFLITAAGLTLTTLTGCSAMGYRLGTMLPPSLQSVYVPTFENLTIEPLIESEATREAITQIQRDGSLKIAGETTADAVLKVTLRRYTMIPVAYNRERRLLANEYRVIITASYVLTEAKTGQVISEHPNVEGEAIIQVTGDMSSAKETGLKPAARDLGHDLVEKIVETWQ